MASIISSTTPLSIQDSRDKRISECGFPAMAVKVDSPYQSYLNHPFTQQQAGKPSHTNQMTQAYISKYNNYTNSSKSIRLITIPSPTMSGAEKSKSAMNDELNLNSPTSPLVSPPPPYLHSDHGETKFRFGFDSKKPADQSPQQLQFAQWPSMMKLSSAKGVTTASVTRPKLARVLPPQAIPILTTGLDNNNSNNNNGDDASCASPATPFPSRTSRLMDTKGSETQYSFQSLQDTYSNNNVSMTVNSLLVPQTGSAHYPVSFWEDARQSKMHWVLLPFGCIMVGSSIWVAVMQVFVEWLIVVPALTFLVFAMQFGRYRWKKSKFLDRHAKNAVAATTTSPVVLGQSCDSDAYLRPHQPLQFDHFRQLPSGQPHMQHHVSFQEPSFAVSPPQFDQQSHKQPRPLQSTKKPSQQQQPQQNPQKRSPPHRGGSNSSLVNNGSPYYQNPNFLSPVDSPQTPPPAYFLKKIELPEIDSIGDLVSEFEVDFDAIRY
ncbi:hypothetical protein BGX26_003604 [Mortierella sp. AD094]|nr:hypothetical protein BGX26_003604 [Mortierella sp. AD094]